MCVCILMRHIVIYRLSGSIIIFPTFSHKRHDFSGGRVIEYKICVFHFVYDISLKYFSF